MIKKRGQAAKYLSWGKMMEGTGGMSRWDEESHPDLTTLDSLVNLFGVEDYPNSDGNHPLPDAFFNKIVRDILIPMTCPDYTVVLVCIDCNLLGAPGRTQRTEEALVSQLDAMFQTDIKEDALKALNIAIE